MERFKIGDLIEWSFDNQHPSVMMRNKTFQAEIEFIDVISKEYAVNASYGRDYISFDRATLIKKK